MIIALGQINTTVGDLAGNVDRMIRAAREAAAAGAQMVVFPELSVTGYPPRDLVEKPTFVERSGQQLERLAAETAPLPLAVIPGYVGPSPSSTGKRGPQKRAHYLRGRLERQAVLGAPALPPRPRAGTGAFRRRTAHQHQRFALSHGQTRSAPRDIRSHRAASRLSARLREPGRRQRSTGV